MRPTDQKNRAALEQIGMFAEFFVDRCVYLSQYPNGEIGGKISAAERALRLQALLLGCVIDLTMDARSHRSRQANTFYVSNTHTGVEAEVGGVQARCLRSPGTIVLRSLADRWQITSGRLALEISGQALQRLAKGI